MLSGKYRFTAIIAAVLMSFPCLAVAASTLQEANALTRQFVQQTMKQQRIPGLQVAVIKDGQVVLSESYGFANVENQVPVTGKTLFPINSATKSFTGVAMMQLAEAGLVDLDAPAPDWQVAGIGGARAAFVVYPDDGLAIVVLTNLAGANPQRFIPRIVEFYRPLQRARSR